MKEKKVMPVNRLDEVKNFLLLSSDDLNVLESLEVKGGDKRPIEVIGGACHVYRGNCVSGCACSAQLR